MEPGCRRPSGAGSRERDAVRSIGGADYDYVCARDSLWKSKHATVALWGLSRHLTTMVYACVVPEVDGP